MQSRQQIRASALPYLWAVLVLTAIDAAAGGTAGAACLVAPGQAEVFIQGSLCVWESAVSSTGDVMMMHGIRQSLDETATPTVVAPATALPSSPGSPGKLHVLCRAQPGSAI
jgi:hypothetical protein